MFELLHGSYDRQYNLAPELARQVLLSNPGSIAICSRDDATESSLVSLGSNNLKFCVYANLIYFHIYLCFCPFITL